MTEIIVCCTEKIPAYEYDRKILSIKILNGKWIKSDIFEWTVSLRQPKTKIQYH